MIFISDLWNFRYNIVFFLLTYLLPMLGMGLCYAQMGLHLWRGDKSAISLLVPQAALTKSRNDKKRVRWWVALMFPEFWFVSDCQDVCLCGSHFHGLLGTVSYLLHLLLPQSIHCKEDLHWPHLSLLLLAGHVQHLRQPHHLLCDELTVPCLFQQSTLLYSKLLEAFNSSEMEKMCLFNK